MHGNVLEWCQDWYGKSYYENSPRDDPTGPAKGSGRVVRGGAYAYGVGPLRSAFRIKIDPDWRTSDLGFRVVLVLP